MATTPVSPNNVVIALLDTGKVIGSQTNFMVNVDRRKLPVLALGRSEPLGYGRGFRIISGIIDYVIINQDLLLEIVKDYEVNNKTIGEYILIDDANSSDDEYDLWNAFQNSIYGESSDNDSLASVGPLNFKKIKPVLLDMLPPLDVIVYGLDETGQVSGMIIKGLEFTTSSLVATINDVALAQRAEWVAKSISPWTQLKESQ